LASLKRLRRARRRALWLAVAALSSSRRGAAHLDDRADELGDHQPLDVFNVAHSLAGELGDQVLGPEPGGVCWAARNDLDHLDALLLAALTSQPRGQRPGPSSDAQVGARHFAARHEVADQLAGGVIDWHGEPESNSGDGGVDPDEPAGRVDESSARVPGIERGVGLNHVVDHPECAARLRGQGSA
jgi:hypothetical protein